MFENVKKMKQCMWILKCQRIYLENKRIGYLIGQFLLSVPSKRPSEKNCN